MEYLDLYIDYEEIFVGETNAHINQGQGPFLRIRKKISPMVNLDATRQTALTITGSGDEEEAPSSKKRASI